MTRKALPAGVAACSVLAAFVLAVSAPGHAATIPAWLDDAISGWNTTHPEGPIEFVAIKDAYVWYRMAGAPELASKDIRDRVYGITEANGYVKTQDEEMVTTARPPAASGPSKTSKCWTRTFLRDPKKGATAANQRMLTTMVCEEDATWSAGFRVLE